MEPRVDKCNLLRGGCSDSGISSLRSTGGGMDRDGGSGGRVLFFYDGVYAAVTSSIESLGRAPRKALPCRGGASDIGGEGDGDSVMVEVSQLLPLIEGFMEAWGRDIIQAQQ
ncbi:hypothetical protein Tco_0856660 [Tanacetum coccineum]|uniref:Uncharacterized protein n=1 Tax=Tanacetum coccineum TaxID=301880 RepID=A0ABQ5B7X2_9ASTR